MTAEEKIIQWFENNKWKAFPFQEQTWQAYNKGFHGLINAPTGSGKTYAIGLALLIEYLNNSDKKEYQSGLQALWITPIKALAKEIEYSLNRACDELNIPWQVARRTGDTSSAERTKQKKNLPQILITTPESLQLLLASKDYPKMFQNLKCVINDEWHELIGTKRAVQMELAQSRLLAIQPKLKVWGISATIGNMEQSMEVLFGNKIPKDKIKLIKSKIKKKINVITLMPEVIEKYPWGGHLGIQLLGKVIPVIKQSRSTLIFTNTRAQAEIWYQRILEEEPNLAGQIAMHHGSISKEIRDWVEDALHAEKLKAVVCTSSLDLGVDFRPVETIVQIGSPKGVARYIQRAGRSGHQPGAESTIYFVPTHSLEIIESSALRQAIKENHIEDRTPFFRSFDVLIQYLVTLAVSEGFKEKEIFEEVKSTFSFESISRAEWEWVLKFIIQGGESLQEYNEYKKVEQSEDGLLKVYDRGIAMKHRLSIGTIVSEPAIRVCYLSGKFIGTVEEYFISRLNPGDVFWFSGRNLEFIQMKGVEALVKLSKKKIGKVPSWQGGRMPLSSQLSDMLRIKIQESSTSTSKEVELKEIFPLIKKQQESSIVPTQKQFLIEYFESKEGFHAFFYPFEGRFVHEGMASVIGYRLSLLKPMTFSIALNDYGFELLCDQEIPLQEAIDNNIFTADYLQEDIKASVNSTEMARRKFRDIASISGLVFHGYPGKSKKQKHLQASSQLFFEVFNDYEKDNLLLLQAFEEVMEFQLEESRMIKALERIEQQEIVIKRLDKASPFSFPIMVDRLRERMSFEKLEDRIRKMKIKLE